jgi:hypothetical protein
MPLTPLPQELPEHSEAIPSVMITLPFNPKMMDKRSIEHSCNLLIEKAKEAMESRYEKSQVSKVFQKLTHIAKHLEYGTHKISIAILVSPDFERIYYLDFPVTEQVTVDDQFNFRDLVMKKAFNNKFLLLMLSEKRARICLADDDHITPLVIGHPYDNSILSSSVDSGNLKDEKLDLFFLKTEQSLQNILATYPYPVLLMSNAASVRMFNKLSRNKMSITETIIGNFDDSSPSHILTQLKKVRIDTRKLREKYYLNRLEEASLNNKLAIGIQECIISTNARNVRLLVVEKGYAVTTFIAPNSKLNEIQGLNSGEVLVIKDLVDLTIEKVFQAGGEVEIVNDGVLSDYMHIALVKAR